LKVKAAVAFAAGKPLEIELVDLEGPKAGEVLVELKALASKNRVFRSYIGTGYHGAVVPPVIFYALIPIAAARRPLPS